ncbi:hypothetical protein LRR18_12650 [Mangrovimonas sp. AS39]|uniref:hypothetical protein n=1 Tax=Mangrovimonas futianensis TaxID=2895523 RepID=UPI001E56DAA6|nr:hypothetical protein [Mangrovimonas futianensis]MCF1192437.1 hypothetical protein [Mangrovimonas futianensis]MCF1196233.1 hypothetical protein [Mangrovimonas futianensis]
MAPLKFEEKLKEQLEERMMQPSNSVWDKLELELDAQTKKSQKRQFWIIGLAASLVGVVLLSTLFYKMSNQETLGVEEKKLVEEPQAVEQINQIPFKDTKKGKVDNNQMVFEETETESKSNPSDSPLVSVEKEEVIEANRIIKNQEEESFKERIEETTLIAKHSIKEQKVDHENEKVQDLANSLKTLKETHGEGVVAEEDISALLAQAQKEINDQKIYKENSKTVDAMMLLQDVEDDLDHSFRDKVFEALQVGYKTVKTAVAQRNY